MTTTEEAVNYCVFISEMMKVFADYPVGKLVFHRGYWLKVVGHIYPKKQGQEGYLVLENCERRYVPATVTWKVEPGGKLVRRIPEGWIV